MAFFEIVEQLFAKYGYLVLILGLPLDAIALPIPPGNTTLTYTGYLAYKGILDWRKAVLAAYLGSVIGMTITYWLGNRIGSPLISRYGKWLRFKPQYMDKIRRAYAKHGNKVLLFSFFMPGARQLIGYFAGTIRVPFQTFAFYAYLGSALWVLGFAGIGYIFGEQWKFVIGLVEEFFLFVTIGILALIGGFFALRWIRKSRARAKSPS